MPAPQASQLEGIATGAMQSANIAGENAADLGKALAQVTADALNLFFAQAMVMPGIPAGVDPISGSGSTAGPGMLMPPPAGGPMGPQLLPLAQAALSAKGIKGQNAPALAAVIADALAQAIMLFTTQVQVAPGIAVAGFVTTGPGSLM
ncbi:MAG: hypothetical protein OEV42_04600 [Deltaproteobacteria bacterium]|nr:hypothetical protein [Deltaproteobacteria bacterium]